MGYLDDTGLRRVWSKIKSLYNNAVVGLSVSGKTLKYTRGNGTISSLTLPDSVTTATKASQDSSGQTITSTYIKALQVSGVSLKYTKGNGTTGTVTLPYTGPKIQCEVSSNSVLIASNARGELQVTFPEAFSAIPTVTATPYTSGGHATEIAVKNITKTGFTALFKNSWNYEAYFKASYIAIER